MRNLLMISLLLISMHLYAAEQKKMPSQIDACTILSQKAVEDILGEKANPGKQVGSEKKTPGALDAAVSNCTWESTAKKGGMPHKSLYLWVRQAPAATNDSTRVMESLSKDPQSGAPRGTQAINGLGDSAFWISGIPNGSNQPQVEMDAMKKEFVVQVIVTGFKDAIEAQGKARTAIEKTWTKLGLK